MKINLAVIGTYQEYNKFVSDLDLSKYNPVHIYHKRCLYGLEFQEVKNLQPEQPYFRELEIIVTDRINVTGISVIK